MENLIKNKNLAWQKIGGQTVIIDARVNKEVFRLNELGSFVWEHVGDKKSLPELVDLICEEFDVESDIAKNDAQEFIGLLTEKSLVLEDE